MSSSRYGGEARPDRYIKTVSATLLSIVKISEGLLSGYVLFNMLKVTVLMMGMISKGAWDLHSLLQSFLQEQGIQNAAVSQFSDALIGVGTLPFIFVLVLLLIADIGILLIVIDAVSAAALRFFKKWADAIRTVHLIYMSIWIIYLIVTGYIIYLYIRYHKGLAEGMNAADNAILGMNIAFAILAVLSIIAIVMNICYHKDIAMAMRTISYEIRTGRPGGLRRTHLSGISFCFALSYLLLIISLFSGTVNGEFVIKSVNELSAGGRIPALVICICFLLKHLCVCFCNRNLKRAR